MFQDVGQCKDCTPPKSDIHLVRGVCQVHTPVIGQWEARNLRSTGTKGDNNSYSGTTHYVSVGLCFPALNWMGVG